MALLVRLTVCVLLLPTSLWAADYTTKDSGDTGCPPSIHHQARPDVAYKAGENAQGWAVAPADITPPALTAEHIGEVEIPVRMPMEQRHPQSVETGAADHKAGSEAALTVTPPFMDTGRVTVNAATGELRYNGHDISAIDPNELDPDCISAQTH